MTIQTNPQSTFSPFLPATFTVPEDEDRLRTFLVDNLSAISDVVNDKKIGVFVDTVSIENGNKFSYDTTKRTRSGYQYLARIVSYPANGVIVLPPPPLFNNQCIVFQVWGSASKPFTTAGTGDYFSFYGEGNSKITFTFTDTAITVTTVGLGAGYTGFIIVDYIVDGI